MHLLPLQQGRRFCRPCTCTDDPTYRRDIHADPQLGVKTQGKCVGYSRLLRFGEVGNRVQRLA